MEWIFYFRLDLLMMFQVRNRSVDEMWGYLDCCEICGVDDSAVTITVVRNVPTRCEAGLRRRLRFFEFPVFHDGSIDAEHLNTRAWTLQERGLSRRVISFSSKGLLWECNELRATSQRPWENIDRSIRDAAFTRGLFKSNTSWDAVVEDCSVRSLTKQTDKLIALSGIARAAQEFYQDATYVAGIWSSLIPEVLLWLTAPQQSNAERVYEAATESAYIAPSRSWASVKSTVDYRLVRGAVNPEAAPGLYAGATIVQQLKVEEMVRTSKHVPELGLDGSLIGAH